MATDGKTADPKSVSDTSKQITLEDFQNELKIIAVTCNSLLDAAERDRKVSDKDTERLRERRKQLKAILQSASSLPAGDVAGAVKTLNRIEEALGIPYKTVSPYGGSGLLDDSAEPPAGHVIVKTASAVSMWQFGAEVSVLPHGDSVFHWTEPTESKGDEDSVTVSEVE